MLATHVTDSTTMTAPALYPALELSWTTGNQGVFAGQRRRKVTRSAIAFEVDQITTKP